MRILQQLTVLQNRNFESVLKLQVSSNGSQLMGELPYHLRMSLGVLALDDFPAKPSHFPSISRQFNALCSPLWAWGFGQKERRSCVREKKKVLCNKISKIHIPYTTFWFSKSQAINAFHQLPSTLIKISIMNNDLCQSLKVKDINHLIDARCDASCD